MGANSSQLTGLSVYGLRNGVCARCMPRSSGQTRGSPKCLIWIRVWRSPEPFLLLPAPILPKRQRKRILVPVGER